MIEDLERAIGWRFRDRTLLETALTTPARRMDHPGVRDNQRLEFLGDAVFGLLCAESLYRLHGEDDEGALTVRRTHLASGAALAAAADRIGLSSHLVLNDGADPSASRTKESADAMEAVLGAVWLDGGIDAARAVFARLWPDQAGPVDIWEDNPKGRLQVWAQARHPPVCPVYRTVSTSGPPHAPVWRVSVEVQGVGSAEGEGSTKRAAEAAAARAMLDAAGTGGAA